MEKYRGSPIKKRVYRVISIGLLTAALLTPPLKARTIDIITSNDNYYTLESAEFFNHEDGVMHDFHFNWKVEGAWHSGSCHLEDVREIRFNSVSFGESRGPWVDTPLGQGPGYFIVNCDIFYNDGGSRLNKSYFSPYYLIDDFDQGAVVQDLFFGNYDGRNVEINLLNVTSPTKATLNVHTVRFR